jgi:SAM-dependent methyltransferase
VNRMRGTGEDMTTNPMQWWVAGKVVHVAGRRSIGGRLITMNARGRIGAITAFHDQLTSSGAAEPYWLDGWGSADGQRVRFDALARTANFRGGTVVDYGCGTGALREYLATLGYPFTYLGLDMNENLLKTEGDFRRIEADSVDFPAADYVFASGVFQFADEAEPDYYRRLVRSLFQRCRVALAVNFLSALRDDAAKDPEELYMTPAEAIGLASSLSGRWLLDHSYHPERGDLTIGVFA